MAYAYHIISREDGTAYLTVFIPGENPLTVADDHPNYDQVLQAVQAGETAEKIRELADIPHAIATRFERITTRVTVANGTVYFDGDEVHSSIADAIVRALEEQDDETAYTALALFLEKVASNPEPHSREQLFDWLAAHRFVLTVNGDIVGHKGMVYDEESGSYGPSYGHGYVNINGVRHEGGTGQEPGDFVELPRSEVSHDPASSCSFGLHVGTPGYAASYGDTQVLVIVNPRDVVSVPTEAGGGKVRVCRYLLLGRADNIGLEGYVVLPQQEFERVLADEPEEQETCVSCGDEATTTDIDGDPSCQECADDLADPFAE